MGEFELIERFLKKQSVYRKDVLLGIGDDAAIVQVPKDSQLAVTTDTLVAGTHFLFDALPADIAYKALVSNISDLAAMGSEPAWCSLALTLPEQDPTWLNDFCQSFFALAKDYNIALIGGDTTKGPLAISITLHGFVQAGKALCRKGAKVGDWIFVSGSLGDSAAGLKLILEQDKTKQLTANERYLVQRHFYKSPRVELGKAIQGIASSCLDISDGLCADLQHILRANQVGAQIDTDKLPVSKALKQFAGSDIEAAKLALTSGEEYELCFTVPDKNLPQLKKLQLELDLPLSCIGQIVVKTDLTLRWFEQEVNWSQQGWDHFKKTDNDEEDHGKSKRKN